MHCPVTCHLESFGHTAAYMLHVHPAKDSR